MFTGHLKCQVKFKIHTFNKNNTLLTYLTPSTSNLKNYFKQIGKQHVGMFTQHR